MVTKSSARNPSFNGAIQELTRAVRQLAKGSTVTTAIRPIEPEDEPDEVAPPPPADLNFLAETASNLFRMGKPLAAIKSELLEIAHSWPCKPPLSEDYVCDIAEKYGQRPKSTRPPMTEVLDDPVKRREWIANLPNTPYEVLSNEHTALRSLIDKLGRDYKTDPAGKEMLDAFKPYQKRRMQK